MKILRYIAFSKIIFDISVTNCLLFSTLKNKPSRSRRSASGVKEKCVRGQREVRWESRKNVSWAKEKFIGVKEKCFRWMCGIQLKHFSLTPDALFLDPGALLLAPWRTSPWPLMHFSLSWRAYFSELKKSNKLWKKNSKLILEMLYILKYSYASVVIAQAPRAGFGRYHVQTKRVL